MFSPRVEEILDLLIDLPPHERLRRLGELCAGDEDLRSELTSLVQAFEASTSFLEPTRRGSGLRPSDRLGRYHVLAEIGRGAMGVVCLAQDSQLGRNVALKTLTPEAAGSRARRERLREEARMLAAVNQPNVAQVYSFEEIAPVSDSDLGPRHRGAGDGIDATDGTGATDGNATDGIGVTDGNAERPVVSFLTMEYVPGTTLAEKLRGGALPLEASLEIGRQIAAALEAAHAQGVVHRDLKPQNIRITPDGWVKVLDFGLAFSPEAEPGASRRFCGTPGYMSPEQAGSRRVGFPSDLWSFGCVLYECLTGRAAVDAGAGASLNDLLALDLEKVRIDRERLPGSLVPALRNLLDRLFAIDPAERPTATEARRQLEEESLRLRAHALFARSPSDAREPPRASAGAARGNLPRRLSEFIGRESVLSEAETLLDRHRLLTLTGTGGSGKTRLALEIGARLSRRYPGGVWFIDLSTIESGDLVVSTAAHALGVRDAQGGESARSFAAAAARTLGNEPALLVVDNCEHVLAAAVEWIGTILDLCPSAVVLATSRTPLGTPDEQIYVVPPLRLPADPMDLQACRESESVRLFEARARSRQPSFRLRDEHLRTVATICKQADGLPLAIEIAASHSRALAAEEILARLEANPLSLGAPGAAGPQRHRSLAGVVRWSYRLLNRPERLLFERLSVFRGGWTLTSAEAVCARDGLSGWQLHDLLARLVERSLVEVEALEGGRQARYRLLETIQRFARERLARREGEPEATEARYVDHFAAYLAPRVDETGLSIDWLARVDAEHANLNESLEICLRRGWHRRLFSMSVRMGRYWANAGHWREGAACFRRILALPEASMLPEASVSPKTSMSRDVRMPPAAGMNSRASMPPEAGLSREASSAPEASGHLAGHAPDPKDIALAYGAAARLYAMLEEPPTAAAAAEEGLRWAERAGDSRTRAGAARDRGIAHWFAYEIDAAEARFRESLEGFRALNDRAGISTCVGNLAAIHGYRQQHAQALPLFEEQLRLSEELGDRLGVAKALMSIGRMLQILGRAEEALRPLEEAYLVHREAHDAPGMALCLHNLGDTCTALGRHEEARRHLLEAAEIRLHLGNKQGVCSVLLSLGHLASETGDPEGQAILYGGLMRAFAELQNAIPPGRRSIFDTIRRTTQQALGKTRFEQAAARGAAMDLVGLHAWAADRFAARPLT